MLLLASLKGMVQGFLVTAPAILVLKLVGDEDVLGLIQGISGTLVNSCFGLCIGTNNQT